MVEGKTNSLIKKIEKKMKQINVNGVDVIVHSNGTITNCKTNKIIKFHKSNGYLRARIGNKQEYLHRLIAKAFISKNIENYSINHIDGNKLNNSIKNLEILSLSENTKHAHETGINNNKGELNKSSLLTKKQALEIFNSNKPYKELSKQYNISISTISLIKNKKKWKIIHLE